VPIRLDAAAVSDVGPHRSLNQDSAFAASWGAAVADGVGGGPSGDLASAALVHRLVAGHAMQPDQEQLVERLRLANWEIRAHSERTPALRGMATTFTGLFVGADERLLLAHAGDSRAYTLRAGALARETRDDSYVQELVDRGLVAPSDAATHPRRNVITASFQGAEADLPGVTACSAVVGDRWLLCSDGLTDYVPEDLIAEILSHRRAPAEAAESLVAAAIDAGTHDNVTAVVCDVADGGVDRDAPVFSGAAAARFTEGLEAD
jgi:protein phosphatase